MLALFLAISMAQTGVTWDTVTETALVAWDEGPGVGLSAQVDGARSASSAVPVGPTALRGESQLGLAEQRQYLLAVDVPLSLGVRERRYWTAVGDEREAGLDAHRFDWVRGVHDAWLSWWVASELDEHLEEYAATVDADLVQFEQAVGDGLLAPIHLDDLRAESLQVHSEAAQMQQQARVAAAQLHTLLGERSFDAGDHDLHDIEPTGTNPWSGLSDLAHAMPSVRQADALAVSERRRASALTAERSPVLFGGPMWAPNDTGDLTPFAYVGVSVPLQPGVEPERRLARAAATAATADRVWQERRAQAHLEQEAVAWDAMRARMVRLQTEVLGPLTVRQERLEQALIERLVTADRVVRARRDRHEAEHELIVVAGELLASSARAEAMRDLLEGQ